MNDAPWWQEDLERLRREQNPDKYQPVLRLPVPAMPMPTWDNPYHPDALDKDPPRGVYITDMQRIH